jgi:hypothetical protein
MDSLCAHTSGMAEPLGLPGCKWYSGMGVQSHTCSGNMPTALDMAAIAWI